MHMHMHRSVWMRCGSQSSSAACRRICTASTTWRASLSDPRSIRSGRRTSITRARPPPPSHTSATPGDCIRSERCPLARRSRSRVSLRVPRHGARMHASPVVPPGSLCMFHVECGMCMCMCMFVLRLGMFVLMGGGCMGVYGRICVCIYACVCIWCVCTCTKPSRARLSQHASPGQCARCPW